MYVSVSVSSQIIATSHDLDPKKVAKEVKSPYFRQIQVGELLFHLGQVTLPIFLGFLALSIE